MAAQDGAPWQWYALRSPTAFVAFVAWVGATAAVAGAASDDREGTLRGVSARVHLFVSSGLGAALFLGGYQIPGFSGDPLYGAPLVRVVAAAVFVIKAGVLMLAIRRLGGRPSWSWTLPSSLLAVAASVLLLVVGVPMASIEVVAGPVLCTVAALVLASVAARAVWPPVEPSRVRPFL